MAATSANACRSQTKERDYLCEATADCDPDDEYEYAAPGQMDEPRICVALTTCSAGEYVYKSASSGVYGDRRCLPCAPGTYSTTENAETCIDIADSPPTDNTPYNYASMTTNAVPVTSSTPCPAGYKVGPAPYIQCVPDSTDDGGLSAAAIAGIVAGCAVAVAGLAVWIAARNPTATQSLL